MNNNKASFVNFPIGNACNLRCKFCYNDNERNNKQYFEDIEILKKRLLDYDFREEKIINIIGGEPLLYPKIFELLEFLKINNFFVKIVTNGTKLGDRNFLIKFLEYRNIIKNINLSIHSHNSELEEIITSRKFTFEKKILGIEALIKNNFNYSLSLVLNIFNIKYLSEITLFYNNKYNKSISIQGILTYPNFSDININTISKYSDNIKFIQDTINNGGKINTIHWIPLCIHSKIKNISYKIRELNKEFIFSFKWNGDNLLSSHLNKNYIGDKCRKCYAFKKFCFGPGKIYVNKYGYDEFESLSKNDVIKLIKLSNKNSKNGFYKKI